MKLGIVAQSFYFHNYRSQLLGAFDGTDIIPIPFDSIPRGSKSNDIDMVLVIGIHEHMNLPVLRNYVLAGIQTEQLPCEPTDEFRINRNLKRFKALQNGYDHLFEWSPEIYASGHLGKNATWLPHGCEPKPMEPCNAQHDLFFVGNLPGTRNRRQSLLEQIGRRHRLYPTVYVNGAEKEEAIRSSAICLNIHYYESGGFESPRMFDYLSLGAFVLSERSNDSFPFKPGEDFIDYDGEADLHDKIEFYLSHPDEREKIRLAGHRKASEYPFDAVFRRLSLEIRRLHALHRHPARRILARLHSKAKTIRFHTIDQIAASRRRLTTSRK